MAAGMAALTSAAPALFPHRVALGLLAIVMIVVINLRGVRESGRIFATPTYLFVGTILLMVGVGLVPILTGQSFRAEP